MILNIPFTYSWLIRKNIKRFKTNSILELGCGKGAFGDLVNSKGSYKITGVDIFKPYLEVCKAGGKYEKVLKIDLTKKLPFRNKSFGIVVCLQTIEHLDKKSGILLLKEMERVAGEAILISLPNGKCVQEEYDSNKYQRHLSKWETFEFEKRGYKVWGTGLKLAYGSHSHVGDKVSLSKLPLYLISFIMNPIVFLCPDLAAQLVALKEKNES